MYPLLSNNSLVLGTVLSRSSAIAEDIEDSVKVWPSDRYQYDQYRNRNCFCTYNTVPFVFRILYFYSCILESTFLNFLFSKFKYFLKRYKRFLKMDRVKTCVVRSDDRVILDVPVTNNDDNTLYSMLPYYWLSNVIIQNLWIYKFIIYFDIHYK